MNIQFDDEALEIPLKKIVCVGRNYAEHAREFNNPLPDSPILFIKPASSAVPMEKGIALPEGQGSVHHELEIALLIAKTIKNVAEDEVYSAIGGLGLALDLTLRDVQRELKQQGHPWEIAKSFDGACPLSPFVSVPDSIEWENLQFRLFKNGQLQQEGAVRQMLFKIPELICYMSQHFTLEPGDIILTGTPAGVGPLTVGDRLQSSLDCGETSLINIETSVVESE